MSKKRNIECQMVIIMNNLCRFGESKYDAKVKKRLELEEAIKACTMEEEKSKLRAEAPEGIFSFSTMKTYIKLNKTFCRWVKKNHPVRDIKYAREFTGEYLQYCIDKGNSPSTIKTKAAALAKLYHTHSYELGIVLPNRKREDITRSRTIPDEKIEKKNQDVVDFIKGTGGPHRIFQCVHTHRYIFFQSYTNIYTDIAVCFYMYEFVYTFSYICSQIYEI